jgi:hypothetical protein
MNRQAATKNKANTKIESKKAKKTQSNLSKKDEKKKQEPKEK